MRKPTPARSALALVLACCPLACAAPARTAGKDVSWLVRHGHYAEADALARERLAARPGDPELQQLARDAELAHLLERGRRAVFSGRVADGLMTFRQALELDPDNEIALSWILKTRVQLAEDALDRAVAHAAGEELVLAEKQYDAVLAFLPEEDIDDRVANLRRLAKDGLLSVLTVREYRESMSRSYFREGMTGYRDFRLAQAYHDFSASESYDEKYQRATDRRGDVEDMLASERIAKAQGLEDEGYFHAARTEYRIVLLVDDSNREAREGLERMNLEVRAHVILARAEMAVLRAAFEDASELLDEAAEITTLQQDRIGQLRAQLQDHDHARMYEIARGFERDYLFSDAVAAYDALLAKAEFYEDAIARRSTLQGFIERAETLYAAALEAESDKEALSLLKEIPTFYPEFRDTEERIRDLEAGSAPSAPESSAGEVLGNGV